MKRTKLNTLFLIILVSFLGIQNTFSLYLSVPLYNNDKKLKTSQTNSLIIGVRSGPHSLDPHDAWDHESYNVIEQVCEGFIKHKKRL